MKTITVMNMTTITGGAIVTPILTAGVTEGRNHGCAPILPKSFRQYFSAPGWFSSIRVF